MAPAPGADPIDAAVGARIRARRRALGMSQATLAHRLGVGFRQVQDFERGGRRISAAMLAEAARALQCRGDDLLGAPAQGAEAAGPQDGALQAEIDGLLATPGAEELLRAFGQLPTGEARASVIAIVAGLASGSYVRRG